MKQYYQTFNETFGYCPICKKEICCFCSKQKKRRGYCCLRSLCSETLFRKKYSKGDFNWKILIFAYIAFIIPYTNGTGVILSIMNFLIYYDCKYHYYVKRKKYYKTRKIVNVLFSFCMSICYLSLTLVFMIITFLMSIPFRMDPLNNLISSVSGMVLL